VVFWYIFSRFGSLHQEKSGNPGWDRDFGAKEMPEVGSNIYPRLKLPEDGDNDDA
jgi:hypothetical protein